MSVRTLRREQWLPRPRAEVFDFFKTPENLATITPPWLGFRVLTPGPLAMRAGAKFEYEVSPLGIPQRWRTRIESYSPPDGFVDVQETGPYRFWRHEHRFEEKDGGTLVTDEVTYELPLQPFGDLAHFEVARRLRAIFDHRESAVGALFRPAAGARKVVVAGGSGWIGRDLCRALVRSGRSVVVLSRKGGASVVPGVETRAWLSSHAAGWESELEGAEAIVNLCGEGVADGPWTRSRRARLVASRLVPTAALAAAVAKAARPPRVFLSASAVGFYPQGGDAPLDERAAPGDGFLADLCVRWERAALEARSPSTRVVLPRIGVVLGPGGGALSRMLPPFKLGLGGRLGDGRQWFPWVHLSDVTGLILAAVEDGRLDGPINAVAPEPATNAQFTAALGRALGRPTPFPVPAAALRLLLGDMSSLLLGSQKVVPAAALAAGYRFERASLAAALDDAAR